MDESTSPWVSNLAWMVDYNDPDRNFIGKDALLEEKQQGIRQQLVGLVMQTKGVLRNQQSIYLDNQEIGSITSGGYSPTLGHAIAFARINKQINSTHAKIKRRNDWIDVDIVKPAFVRHGKQCIKELSCQI